MFDAQLRETHAKQETKPNRNTMKFTKENVKENILAALGNTRKLSDRSVDEIIANVMMFAGEDTELADFIKNVKPIFITANTNLIKEQSDFIKDWGAKNPKKDETKTEGASEGLTADQIAAILDQKLSPLQQELESYRAERTTEGIFARAQKAFLDENKIDESNEKIKRIKERVFATVKSKVGKDSKVEDITSSLKAEFEDLAIIAGIDSPYVPAEPSGGSTDSSTDFKNALSILEGAGKIPTKNP